VPAPEGATDYAVLAVCLKAYPDMNLGFPRNLWSGALSEIDL
jgi:hypothetical protein